MPARASSRSAQRGYGLMHAAAGLGGAGPVAIRDAMAPRDPGADARHRRRPAQACRHGAHGPDVQPPAGRCGGRADRAHAQLARPAGAPQCDRPRRSGTLRASRSSRPAAWSRPRTSCPASSGCGRRPGPGTGPRGCWTARRRCVAWLTGCVVIDRAGASAYRVTDASATAWDPAPATCSGSTGERLPPIAPPPTLAGPLRAAAATALGIPAGTARVRGRGGCAGEPAGLGRACGRATPT